MAAKASKSVLAWVTITSTPQRLDPAPAEPPRSQAPRAGDMTGGSPDEYELERGNRFPWRPGVFILGRTTISKLRLFAAASAVGLVLVAPAASAPATPVPVGPPDGFEVTFLPTVSWNAVGGADHYI